MKKHVCFLCGGGASRLLRRSLLFCSAVSAMLCAACTRPDPMDPYKELGVPKGFTEDTYRQKTGKSAKPARTGFTFFTFSSKEEEERRKKFRDVSRPMDSDTVKVFPWRSSDSGRSRKLHDEIRRDSGRSDPLH